MAQPMKAAQGRPPDKGSFPLDHLAECKAAMEEYMRCMKESGMETIRCREQSAAYLSCRMEHNLMAKEDLVKLGFRKVDGLVEQGRGEESAQSEAERGFIAGLGRVNATRQQQSQSSSGRQ
jgi:cytochrome c oxidase assembly protein subunit 19